MSIKTLTFLFAAAAAAASVYRLGRRAPRPISPGRDSAGAAEAATTAEPASNPGERLADLSLADSGWAGGDSRHDDLLAPPLPDEQQADTIKPGLPDFYRGS